MADLNEELKQLIENEKWTRSKPYSESMALVLISEWLRDHELDGFFIESTDSKAMFVIKDREDGRYYVRTKGVN